MARQRRLAFGDVADLYDRARPSYPPALIGDVLEYSCLRPGDLAAEVGAGTGKATLLFAERGLHVLALEPSAEMAAIARRNLAGFPTVSVTEVEFERWMPPQPVELLYSAQAWHWIDPERRFAHAREVLSKDGTLAAFWNRVRWESCSLRAELDEIYRRLAPELGSRVPLGPMHPTAAAGYDLLQDWQGSRRGATGFTPPDWRTYSWFAHYATADYLSLLQTHSDHIVLEPGRRRDLLDAVGAAIDTAGGGMEIEYLTRLGLARPVH